MKETGMARDAGDMTLHLRLNAPEGAEGRWLATVVGGGCFAMPRRDAPAQVAIDGSWTPGDIEPGALHARHDLSHGVRAP